MSNPYLPRVQQKLAHCRMTLELCQNATESQSLQAMVEAALVHLAVGLRLYIRELAHYRGVPLPERLYRLEDLCAATDGGICVDELAEKEFVAAIESAEKNVLSPAVGSAVLIGSAGNIQASDLDRKLLQSWLSSMQELVERQRQSFLEY
ncbi:MAG: hypothetical protein ACRBBW_17015 [Cellvibrionaceae bacterium]